MRGHIGVFHSTARRDRSRCQDGALFVGENAVSTYPTSRDAEANLSPDKIAISRHPDEERAGVSRSAAGAVEGVLTRGLGCLLPCCNAVCATLRMRQAPVFRTDRDPKLSPLRTTGALSLPNERESDLF